MSHPNYRARNRLTRFLRGKGLELGALHMPLDLSHSSVEEVRYVDRMPEEKLREHYPELKDLPLVHVDVLDDAGTLMTVDDGSCDFIIANHLIEHMRDPVGAILCWYTKLKPGGVLYLAVPDMRRTFDRDRPLTDLEHLLADHCDSPENRGKRDLLAFYEWSRLVNKTPEDRVEEEVRVLVEKDYSIHYHTFTDQSMRLLLCEIRERFCPDLRIQREVPTARSSYESIFIVTKGESASATGKGILNRLFTCFSWIRQRP